jgi:hypothetical protein
MTENNNSYYSQIINIMKIQKPHRLFKVLSILRSFVRLRSVALAFHSVASAFRCVAPAFRSVALAFLSAILPFQYRTVLQSLLIKFYSFDDGTIMDCKDIRKNLLWDRTGTNKIGTTNATVKSKKINIMNIQ